MNHPSIISVFVQRPLCLLTVFSCVCVCVCVCRAVWSASSVKVKLNFDISLHWQVRAEWIIPSISPEGHVLSFLVLSLWVTGLWSFFFCFTQYTTTYFPKQWKIFWIIVFGRLTLYHLYCCHSTRCELYFTWYPAGRDKLTNLSLH